MSFFNIFKSDNDDGKIVPVEAIENLPPEAVQVIREQYQRERPAPSVQTTFNYAWGLVRSGNKQDIEEGMKVLWGLYKNQPHLSRECLFYLCIGHLKLGNYSDARKYIVALLKEEPSNTQFEALKDLIDQRVQEEGLTGMAIVGGAAAVAVGVVAAIVRAAH